MEEFELKLRISPSESSFVKEFGVEMFNTMKLKCLTEHKYSCCGCGYRPLDEKKHNGTLNIHIISINSEEPEKSECNILCKACHSTQHIDVSIENDWVQLVNSSYSQKSLIELCRIQEIFSSVKDENTRFLNINPADFIDRLKNDTWPITTKAKVIFKNTFDWGDL